ncbi:transmembrane O-methyltransferase homolog [Limanda limanda]|uniref:transmembrane O-methyltransferase homolog n=1 Tax=Limanda limanda TaxID=27771 RepID=UPI0029C6EF0E|nr:transmembrane O-methyltransferase homolog [Limanda limanda]
MWLVAVSVPLLPAIVLASRRYHVHLSSLCLRALGWVLRLLRRGGPEECVRSTHSFVFSNCTHGKVDSVLETFDLYAEMHPSLSIGPEIGEVLDAVVKRVRPSRVLELGTHCGYSSVRLLRLLPPAGRLITVEMDPLTAELGEEVILVSGFKHHQFQVLTSSSAEVVPALRSHLEPDGREGFNLEPDGREGFNLVLMDHDPLLYLADLQALEKEELLCRSGCSVLFIDRKRRAGGLRGILDHVRGRSDSCCSVRTELPSLLEVVYRKERAEGGGDGI